MKKAIVSLTIIILSFTSFAQDEWILIHPYPTLSNLLNTHFISDQEGWVVGADGLIMYTNDGCETWDIQHSNPDESFWSIFFIDDSEGWAVGWSYIYHTTNKGETWEQQIRPSVMGDLTDVYFINPDTGWIVGTYKIVLKTTDGGKNWTKIMNNINGGKSFYNVTFTDQLHGCAVGGEMSGFYKAFIMITNDGGNTWIDTSPNDCNNLNAVEFTNLNTGWACGNNRALIKTIDGGITWEAKEEYFYNNFDDIHFFNDSCGVLLNIDRILLTFDAGETWDSIVQIRNDTYLKKFSCWSDNGCMAVGYAGSFSKTLDGLNTWQNYNSKITKPIYELGFLDSYNGYALSYKYQYNYLISTVDGGYNWIADTIIENGPFYNMQIVDNSVYLLNYSSQMMKSLNGGANWELLDIPSDTSHYNDFQFVSENTGYMCSGDGILVKTNDGGHTWADKTLDGDFNLNSIFFINENKGWMVDVQARVILRTTNGGDDWAHSFLGSDYQYQPISIFFINEDEGFATTSEGIIFKSINGGETWEEFYYFTSCAYSEIYFINEIEGWYRSGRNIYHTFDGGESWINRQELDDQLRSMFFLDNIGWVGGNNGLVATTNFTVNVDEFGYNISFASIFPNPANDKIEVKLNDKSDIINNIKVFDLHGKLILNFENLSRQNTLIISVSDFVDGAYIIYVTSDKSETFAKFIVQ